MTVVPTKTVLSIRCGNRNTETGGPPAREPTRLGFGSRMIDRAIRQAETTCRYEISVFVGVAEEESHPFATRLHASFSSTPYASGSSKLFISSRTQSARPIEARMSKAEIAWGANGALYVLSAPAPGAETRALHRLLGPPAGRLCPGHGSRDPR